LWKKNSPKSRKPKGKIPQKVGNCGKKIPQKVGNCGKKIPQKVGNLWKKFPQKVGNWFSNPLIRTASGSGKSVNN